MGRHETAAPADWRAFPPPSGPAVLLAPEARDLVTLPPGPHELVTIPPDPASHVLGAAPALPPAAAGGRRARRLAAQADGGRPSGRHARSA